MVGMDAIHVGVELGRHHASRVELSVLVATAVVFLMAVVLPDAFSGGGAWFAISYVSVRVIGLAVYGRVAWDDPAKRAAVRRFALLSAGGLLAVAAGGVASEDARVWWWAAAVADLFAAVVAGAAEGWDIRPDHFGERHGLFVIIALGESLIVAAAGLSGAERTAHTVAAGVLAVAGTCGLWWTYFGQVGHRPCGGRTCGSCPHNPGARRLQRPALPNSVRDRALRRSNRGSRRALGRAALGRLGHRAGRWYHPLPRWNRGSAVALVTGRSSRAR